MKQFFIIIVFLQIVMLSHGQEEKKWSFGVGGGIYQAPLMKGNAIEDKYFDINYDGLFSVQHKLGKTGRHALGMTLNYEYFQNRFDFNTRFDTTNNIETTHLHLKIQQLKLQATYSYSFSISKRHFIIGVGGNLLNIPIVKKTNYSTTQGLIGQRLFFEYWLSYIPLQPTFLLGYEVNLPKKNKISLNYELKFSNIYNDFIPNNSMIIDYAYLLLNPLNTRAETGNFSNGIKIIYFL